MSLLDFEEDDEARLMRLLDDEEEGTDDDSNESPIANIATSDLIHLEQDLFQMLETSCPAVSTMSIPPQIFRSGSGSGEVRDAAIGDREEGLLGRDIIRDRQSSGESVPDGVSLEWEGSEKGSVDQPGKTCGPNTTYALFDF